MHDPMQLKSMLKELVKRHDQHGGVNEVAQLLGVHRSTLWRLLQDNEQAPSGRVAQRLLDLHSQVLKAKKR
jgi:transcriptional regulator with XRE-family HTH domain